MQAQHRKIIEYIKSMDNIFDVPPYQRTYSWTKNEVSTLLKDIEEYLINQDTKEYYLGNIIVKKDEHSIKIVDGQQRITTLILIAKAIEMTLKQKNTDNENEYYNELLRDLKTIYKVSSFGDSNNGKIKLNTIKDSNELHLLLTDITTNLKETNFKDVYETTIKFFKGKTYQDVCKYFEIIRKRLVCAVIELSKEDNEYLIFESINSKGKNLSQADLIKNYIFFISQDEKIFEYYNKYFLDNFENDEEELDFYRQFECCLNEKSPESKRGRKIYNSIKNHYYKSDLKKAIFNFSDLEELKKFLAIYSYVKNVGKQKNTPDYVKLITETLFLTYFPWIYQIIRNDNNWLVDFNIENRYPNYEVIISKENEKKLFENIKLMCTYHVRRVFDSFERVESAKTIPVIEKEIRNYYVSKGIYQYSIHDKLKFFEENYKNNKAYKVPKDFKNANFFNIYDHDSGLAKAILWLYENKQRRVEKLSWEDMKKYEIEHIFPQNPDETWSVELGSQELNNLRENKLNLIGNLTLLDDNSNKVQKNKNYSFKRSNYKDSRFEITRKVAEIYDKWNSETINDRTNEIVNFIKDYLIY